MEVLEIEVPEKKDIKIMLVPKEDTSERTGCQDSQLITFSRQYTNAILPIIETIKPNFVSIEACNRNCMNYEADQLLKALKSWKIDFVLPFIPEEASSYIQHQLSTKKQLLKALMSELDSICQESPDQDKKFHFLILEAYASMLVGEIEDEENHIGGTVRDSWIAKGIFDKACTISEKKITILHIGDESRIFELSKFLSLLGAKTMLICPIKELKYSSESNLPLVGRREAIKSL
jgi:hypothetical protein